MEQTTETVPQNAFLSILSLYLSSINFPLWSLFQTEPKCIAQTCPGNRMKLCTSSFFHKQGTTMQSMIMFSICLMSCCKVLLWDPSSQLPSPRHWLLPTQLPSVQLKKYVLMTSSFAGTKKMFIARSTRNVTLRSWRGSIQRQCWSGKGSLIFTLPDKSSQFYRILFVINDFTPKWA